MAIGSVIVVVLICFFSLGFYTNHGSGVPVPKLIGLTVDNATNLLKDQGFNYQIDSVYVGDQPPGTIIQQDPDPGTSVKENRVIYLTMVSRLAPNVALPAIEQTPYISAAATLSSYGLKVGDTIYRSDIARDMVLEVRFGLQPIKAGTKIPKGSRLDLVLGDGAGASEVDIPDLLGQDLDAAKFVIKNSGLTLGTVLRQGAVTDSSNAIVVGQSPMKTDSASKISIGTRINLTISQSKKPDGN